MLEFVIGLFAGAIITFICFGILGKEEPEYRFSFYGQIGKEKELTEVFSVKAKSVNEAKIKLSEALGKTIDEYFFEIKVSEQ